MRYKVEVVADQLTNLGEGPIYHPDSGKLTFVDIMGPPALHQLDTATNELKSLQFTDKPICSAAIPTNEKNSFILACGKTLHRFFWDGDSTGEDVIVGTFETELSTKSNDAKADRSGRLWFGTYGAGWNKEEGRPNPPDAGSLYRAEFSNRDTALISHIERNFELSNGLDWSPDNRIMYFVDTIPGLVYAYNYDDRTGEISNRRVVVNFLDPKFGMRLGKPDGMCVDSTGKLWVTGMRSGSVACLDPETGEFLDRVEIPTIAVTSCVFGGPHLNQLFVTTMGAKLGYPGGGGLYRVDGLEAIGLPPNSVKLS